MVVSYHHMYFPFFQKINAKNAFGLHLIDYMKDLLKQSKKEDSGTNFQVASCTLDAGVKIYAYRVDSVHTEAYKMLGSLGRAVDNQDGIIHFIIFLGLIKILLYFKETY